MSIKENTIVSTTDRKVTLLQWLKSLNKNIDELQEKGVKPYFKVMTADEFMKSHENEPTGVDFAVIQENETDIYVIFGKYEIYFSDESKQSGSVNGTGVIGEVFINDEGNENMYLYGKGWIYFSQQSGIYHFADCDNNGAATQFANFDYVYDVSNRVYAIESSSNYKLLTKTPNNVNDVIKAIGGVGGRGYGLGHVDTGNRSTAFGDISSNVTGKFNLFGFYVHNNEVYYSTGGATITQGSGEIQNAVSGTQLKEAVRLANQKTYWHTIRLHNSGTLSDVNITIVIPSHSNNPVARVEDLLAIGAGDIWGCSGTIATTESALPIVTFDAVKFGSTADATIFSGTLGRTYTLTQLIAKSLEYEDNVKEVK